MEPIKYTANGREYEIRRMVNEIDQEIVVATFLNGKRVSPRYKVSIDTALDFQHYHSQRVVDMLVEIAKSDLDSGIVK